MSGGGGEYGCVQRELWKARELEVESYAALLITEIDRLLPFFGCAPVVIEA